LSNSSLIKVWLFNFLLHNIGEKPACEMLMKLTSGVNLQTFYKQFFTATSSPKKDFYTPPPPKNVQQTLYCRLKIARLLYCILKKAPKSRHKKVGKKAEKKAAKRRQKRSAKKAARKAEKSLFLNLSCWCLETCLKPILFLHEIVLHSFTIWSCNIFVEEYWLKSCL